MEKRHKTYFKLNLISLFSIVVSFISVTLAWFAYSGLIGVSTEVNVKAWNIELSKDGSVVSNNVVISLSELYPGMDPVTELINIRNLGDSDAEVKYEVVSARILGDSKDSYQINDNDITSDYIEDLISHYYPFGINIHLSKNYILSKGEEEIFEISISWPLDSGNDELDSIWGNSAHAFQEEELLKKERDSNYQILPSIQVEINLSAQQYLDTGTSSDFRYNLGDEILVDVVNNERCNKLSDTCIKTYIIDDNNTLADTKVTLLPNPHKEYNNAYFNDYINTLNSFVSTWNVNTRGLFVEDLLKIISNDIKSSFLIIENYSNKIIGNLNYSNRLNFIINKAISNNGFFRFQNEKFNYLTSNNCYWTQSNYNDTTGYALIKEDENTSKLYDNSKENLCHVIPIIEMDKNKL